MSHFQSSGMGLQGAADRAQAACDALAEQQLIAVEQATLRHQGGQSGVSA